MYQFERKLNYFLGTVLQGFYLYLGYKITLTYEYEDGFELFVGMIVTDILMNVLGWSFYLIAYKITGAISVIADYDGSKRKVMHWTIRIVLYVIIYLLSMTPLCSMILTPIVHDCTQMILEWINGKSTEVSERILNILFEK